MYPDLNTVKRSLQTFDLLVKGVNDVLSCGVETILENIKNMQLCEFGENIMQAAEFLTCTERLCKSQSETLSLYVCLKF